MTKQTDSALFTPDTIEHICSLIHFNKWLISACFLAGVAAAITLYQLTPTTFPSEAKLLIRYVSEAVPLASGSGNSVVAPGVNVINSEIAILESRDQIEKVVNDIGLNRFGSEGTNETDRFLTLRTVLKSLNIEAVNNSNIISLRFEGSTPALAQDFLSSLIHHYLEKHAEIHRDAGAYEFLSKQTDQLRSRLNETEAELRALKTDTGIISLEDSARFVSGKIEDLERQQREAETSLAASDAKVNMLRPALSITSTNTTKVFPPLESTSPSSPSSNYSLLVERLKQLQNREAQLLYSYMASSGPVLAIRAQISQAQKEVDDEFRLRNQIPIEMTNVTLTAGAQEWSLALRSGEAEGAALRAKIEVLKKQMDQAQAQAKHLATLDERMVQLQRNKELQEENYRYFSKRLEQARVDNALDAAKISSVVVIQPPSYPINKYREKVPQRVGFSLILGLAVGLSLAFVRENVIHTSIKTPAEVATRLGVPLLLSIPFMNIPGRTSPVEQGGVQDDGPVRTKSNGATSPHNLNLQENLRPYCEALRDRIIASTSKADGSTYLLGIAGCHLGAGSSTIVAGLASAMARNNDGQILIIDADVDHASAHRLLSQGTPSMMTHLLGDSNGNTIVLQPNLYMLSSCEATATPAHINVAASITAFAKGLSGSKYRYVIFDLPPVNDISMALRIAPALDGILLVLEAGTGSAAKATQARDLLNQTGHAAMGAILNKTRFFTPSFLGGQK